MPPTYLLWLKRDLRLLDHPALDAALDACRASPGARLLCVYFYEPQLISSPEFDPSHLEFINECLAHLDGALRDRGNRLVTRRGDLPDALDTLWRECPFNHIFSHQETGNDLTYQRDRRAARWCRARSIPWSQPPQDGVVRRLRSRDGWSANWARRMRLPPLPAPEALPPCPDQITSEGILPPSSFGLPPSTKDRQQGGESLALDTLDSFLSARGVSYRKGMSSPLTAPSACSRLSPYLAHGCLSIRTAATRTRSTTAAYRDLQAAGEPIERAWFSSLSSFSSRLRWHCHFIQKLEDEPSLEFRNLHTAYDGLRDESTSTEEARDRLAAWCSGQTGYPMVDACMRSCIATGWLNFRMRAMLASFAAYHLWLHWRQPAIFLAQHFLDFEPGIHFSQFQMQSGTTGINALRIYSPAKQALDQDPQGTFIRHWVPELARVPLEFLANPQLMPPDVQRQADCIIGKHYPPPIVDHATAYRSAREAFAAIRRQPATREEAVQVYQKHGSRSRPRHTSRTRAGRRRQAADQQLELPFSDPNRSA